MATPIDLQQTRNGCKIKESGSVGAGLVMMEVFLPLWPVSNRATLGFLV